ncbi:hypothetical protein [Rhodococcus jostii]|uniref:hypothetical protein n=1 Tax=Rhodococcus jostii TaxID=132919 RepID=UPI00363E5387
MWADGGYAGRLIDWSKRVVSLTVQVVKRTDDVKGFKSVRHRQSSPPAHAGGELFLCDLAVDSGSDWTVFGQLDDYDTAPSSVEGVRNRVEVVIE